MTDAPESPEVVGARARERVARHYYARRPVVRSVVVVAPSAIRAEQTPAMPHVPERYTSVSLAVSPSVTWEQTQTDEASREPWAAIGARLAAAPALTERLPVRRMPWGPAVPRVASSLPVLPELVTGSEAIARRARMARLGALLGEASALLAGESVAVVEKARAAICGGGEKSTGSRK